LPRNVHHTAVSEVTCTLDPVFLLIINPEAAFPLVVADQVRPASENDHIVIINPVEIRCFGDDVEAFRNPVWSYPAGYPVFEVGGAKFLLH
jgi:hypothetical protein